MALSPSLKRAVRREKDISAEWIRIQLNEGGRERGALAILFIVAVCVVMWFL